MRFLVYVELFVLNKLQCPTNHYPGSIDDSFQTMSDNQNCTIGKLFINSLLNHFIGSENYMFHNIIINC